MVLIFQSFYKCEQLVDFCFDGRRERKRGREIGATTMRQGLERRAQHVPERRGGMQAKAGTAESPACRRQETPKKRGQME